MFQYRSSAFGPSVNAIQKHLGAVEKELENIGRLAGRRGSAAASQAGEQLGDAISSLVSDMVERFTARGRAAGDQAAVYGNQALKLGRSYGNDALQRVGAQISTQVEDRPLITLGVALGLGVLIGAAVLSNMASKGPVSAKPRKR